MNEIVKNSVEKNSIMWKMLNTLKSNEMIEDVFKKGLPKNKGRINGFCLHHTTKINVGHYKGEGVIMFQCHETLEQFYMPVLELFDKQTFFDNIMEVGSFMGNSDNWKELLDMDFVIEDGKIVFI